LTSARTKFRERKVAKTQAIHFSLFLSPGEEEESKKEKNLLIIQTLSIKKRKQRKSKKKPGLVSRNPNPRIHPLLRFTYI
jgi:hypothetical protein